MGHRSRRQRNKFECGHVGFGKYCHTCRDLAAGRITLKKKSAGGEGGGDAGTATLEAKPKYWQRAKCPFCGGTRVKKNDINAFSPIDAKEYRCTAFNCGKQFNSEQVKEYEQVEVVDRPKVPYNPRLTDD